MTDEQIKRNALEAEKEHGKFNYQYQGEAFNKGYLAGAHSRDEEIEMLQNQIEKLSEQLKMNAENIQRLRRPLISVEERLPEKLENDCTSDYVLTRIDGPRQV